MEFPMRILIIEDEEKLVDVIQRGLSEQGYLVDAAYDGEEGQYLAETIAFDLIILDVLLPKINGITVCHNLRTKEINTPILMLTARDSIEDRVRGLDSGADDYLVKPFAFSELLARIRALLRRETPLKTHVLNLRGLSIDTITREVSRGDKKITLTTKEYYILEYLMRHPNAVVSRLMLEENAWGSDSEIESNIIDVYIRRLRSKIDVEGEESLIETIRGAGYRLKS
jgi:DNA-binding response OmpR family regulator